MKRRALFISSSSLVAGVAAAIALVVARRPLLPAAPAAASSQLGSTALAVGGPAALAPFPRSGWQVGVQYDQRLDYRVGLGPEKSDDQAAGSGFAIHLTGRWKTAVVEQRGEEARVRIQLEDAKLEAPSGGAPDAIAATARSLSVPFYVDYDGHGRAVRLHVRAGLDRVGLGVLRELVSISQFTTPEAPALSWSTTETDPVGEYQAEYQPGADSTFVRQKTRYIRLAGRGGLTTAGGAAPLIRRAFAQFRIDDWGRTSAVTSATYVTTPTAGDGMQFASQTELALALVARDRVAPGPAPALDGFVTTMLTPESQDFESAERDTDRMLVGDQDALAMLKEIDALAADDRQGAFGVQVRLTSLFRLDPGAIAKAMAGIDGKNAATILGALGAAGSPEAQKALGHFARDDKQPPAQRQSAVDSMLRIEHPTTDVREALQSMLRAKEPDLRTNASLMLGVVAGRMADDDPAEAKHLVDRLAQDLGAAQDTDERLRIVGSLGNARSADALPAIAESLASDDPAVRAAAAGALRFVPNSSADQLLAKAIGSNDTPDVRRAALVAAGYRSYEPLAPALEAVCKNDPNPSIRSQAVSTLSSMAERDGEALMLLNWVANHDSDQTIRDRAKKAIDGATL